MKAKGALIKEYYYNHWDENWYIDPVEGDTELENDNGEWCLDDGKEYSLRYFPELLWQGDGTCPEKDNVVSFEKMFKRWSEKQESDFVVIKIPKDKAEEFKMLLSKIEYAEIQ